MRKLLQIFDSCTSNLFAPKETWFQLGVSTFIFYCSLTNFLLSLTLKTFFINSGFSLFVVLYISAHKRFNLCTLAFTSPAFSNKPSQDIE